MAFLKARPHYEADTLTETTMWHWESARYPYTD